jgi:hypothetical protein
MPIMVKLQFLRLPFSFALTSYPNPAPECDGRFSVLIPQTTWIATRMCLLDVSSMNIFSGGLLLAPTFQRAFCIRIEKVEEFLTDGIKAKHFTADLNKNGVKKSIGYVTSGVTRPQAAEMVFAPFSTIRKTLITSKRHKTDGKCQQNTNRKP